MVAAAALAAAGCAGALVSDKPAERVVRIHTKKFAFVPNEITLKKGEPVILEFVAEDVDMGFKSTDLKLQVDIFPGKVARLAFTPQKAGRFEFFCNVFCGDGHEDMDGTITVVG